MNSSEDSYAAWLKAHVSPELAAEALAEVDEYIANYRKEILKSLEEEKEVKDYNKEHDPETGRFAETGEGGESGVEHLPKGIKKIENLTDKHKEDIAAAMTRSFHETFPQYKVTNKVEDTFFGKALSVSSGGKSVFDANFAANINFTNKNAHLDLISIPQSHQAHSIGKQMLDENFKVFKQLGMKRVDLLADMSVGGYAWAKYGFTPTQSHWDALRDRLKKEMVRSKITKEQAPAEWAALENKNPKGIWAISDSKVMTKWEGRTIRLGKDLLLGENWDGEIHLDDEEAMARFHSYVRPKKN